jgi:L-serine kinase (ADP)
MNNILKGALHKAIQNLEIRTLHFHEGISEVRLEKLTREIVHDGILKKPVVVDRRTRVVLDGHHRCHVFLRLGIPIIPCYLVDYFDKNIVVTFRRSDIKNKLLKEIILQNVAKGELFPHKTTKHRLLNRPIVNQKLNIPTGIRV